MTSYKTSQTSQTSQTSHLGAMWPLFYYLNLVHLVKISPSDLT